MDNILSAPKSVLSGTWELLRTALVLGRRKQLPAFHISTQIFCVSKASLETLKVDKSPHTSTLMHACTEVVTERSIRSASSSLGHVLESFGLSAQKSVEQLCGARARVSSEDCLFALFWNVVCHLRGKPVPGSGAQEQGSLEFLIDLRGQCLPTSYAGVGYAPCYVPGGSRSALPLCVLPIRILQDAVYGS